MADSMTYLKMSKAGGWGLLAAFVVAVVTGLSSEAGEFFRPDGSLKKIPAFDLKPARNAGSEAAAAEKVEGTAETEATRRAGAGVDSRNEKYDSADLDSDGLLGRGERFLSRDPVRADNPIVLSARKAEVAGVLRVSTSMSFAAIATSGALLLTVDGLVGSPQRTDPDESGNCVIELDTSFMAEGSYVIQAELYDGEGYFAGSSKPLRVEVSGALLFKYPLIPGTPGWMNADVQARFDSVRAPESYLEKATSWELFCSALQNPYFRTIWIPGYDISGSLSASARSPTNPLLPAVLDSPDLGKNVLRFLAAAHPLALEAIGKWSYGIPCMPEYIVCCEIASLTNALGTLDEESRLRLLKIAVWDAEFLMSLGLESAGPINLLYEVYPKLERPPTGVILKPLSRREQQELAVMGDVPANVRDAVREAKIKLGLRHRPK